MRKRTWIIVISLVAAIILLVALKKGGVIGKDEAIKVSAEKVMRRTIIESVNASGKVYPEIEVKVREGRTKSSFFTGRSVLPDAGRTYSC